jgi:hypothetical protein
MFGNFAKIGRAAVAIVYYQHDKIGLPHWILLNVNIIFSLQSTVLLEFQPKFGAFFLIFILFFSLLLKQRLVLLFVFSSSASRAISFHSCV